YSYDTCLDVACWTRQVVALSAVVPVVVLEIGETDCGSGYVAPLMAWLDEHGIGYLGWTWNTWNCSSGPALISSYDGTPTAYGEAVRTSLLAH
ncbi:MAG: endoglucanase, partial [Micromonosporaceae bacterium]|nr:endoglucanase [Micromonosporaceae bacterium]